MNPGNRQAGYTIVEMAIVMVVLGTLLGSVLYPLGKRLTADRHKENRLMLEHAEQAVIGYAMNNNTSETRVVVDGQAVPFTYIPGGRPYLPCPDITGDGLEDRIAMPLRLVPQLIPGNVSVTLTIGTVEQSITTYQALSRVDHVFKDALYRFEITLSNVQRENELTAENRGFGMCFADKGMLPWATLGLPATDRWGNAITYRVDPLWANSLLGFGAESRTDMADPRWPLTVTVVQGQTLTAYRQRDYRTEERDIGAVSRVTMISQTEMNLLPGLVCTESSVNGCSFRAGQPGRDYILGEFTASTLTLFDVYPHMTIARVNPNIIDGMAFVLVSHGENGLGAFRYNLDIEYPSGFELCDLHRSGLPSGAMQPGREYHVYNPEVENYDYLYDGCPTVPPSENTATENHNNGFVYKRHTDGLARVNYVTTPVPAAVVLPYDDDLRFMTGSRLLGLMRSRGHNLGDVWIPPGPLN